MFTFGNSFVTGGAGELKAKKRRIWMKCNKNDYERLKNTFYGYVIGNPTLNSSKFKNTKLTNFKRAIKCAALRK